jgi:hypothetical protein
LLLLHASECREGSMRLLILGIALSLLTGCSKELSKDKVELLAAIAYIVDR